MYKYTLTPPGLIVIHSTTVIQLVSVVVLIVVQKVEGNIILVILLFSSLLQNFRTLIETQIVYLSHAVEVLLQ